jgi:hypothetical protein
VLSWKLSLREIHARFFKPLDLIFHNKLCHVGGVYEVRTPLTYVAIPVVPLSVIFATVNVPE